jgi:hypothetical protein
MSLFPFRIAALALCLFASSAGAVDIVTNGQFASGLTGWTFATSTANTVAGTCSYNAVTTPGTETATSTSGFNSIDATTPTSVLGSMSNTAIGYRSCVLYQDVAIPVGATTAVLTAKSGIKLVGGLASGDTAIFAGLYATTSVPSFSNSTALAGTNRLIIGGYTGGAAFVPQTSTTWNVSTLAGTTVRLAIINAMQSTSSGTGAFIPGAFSVVGLGDVQLNVAVATVPGAPTVGTATAGNAQASVAFTAPASNGGSAITSYTVTSSPGGITATGAASPIVVAGLANGTAYTFTVTATNAIGTGSASTASNSVTPFTIPGAPLIGPATAGNTQASVAFTAAANNGSVITSYTVTASPGGATGSGAASPIVVSGLTNGTPYTFTVTATNAAGTGPASAPSNSVTPLTVPGAPIIGAATGANAQASVAFTAPASNGGSAITGYTVTSSPGGITATGTASPITVTGLTNGSSYTFTVTATNAAGVGPPSAASNSTSTTLNAFTGPTATGSGTATVTVTGGGATCTFAPPGNGPLQSAFFIPVVGHAKSPPSGSAPSGVAFAHGLLDFVMLGCTPGSAVTLTVTYPSPVPATSYWKYGPTAGQPAHWYILPATVSGNTVTFSITDGGLGDDDLAANGTIVDQGGPGVGTAAAVQVPTLSEWMLMLLAVLVAGIGVLQFRRSLLRAQG